MIVTNYLFCHDIQGIACAVNKIRHSPQAVFGADGTETIQQFYKDHYIEMAKEVIPFITGVVIPRLTEIKAENKKALVSQYNRAKKRRRFW